MIRFLSSDIRRPDWVMEIVEATIFEAERLQRFVGGCRSADASDTGAMSDEESKGTHATRL